MKSAMQAAVIGIALLVSPCGTVQADTWAPIQGNVRLANGTPICAMVLANGQYMFSCDGTGAYNLTVPLDTNGQITLFAFADGFAPFSITLAPTTFPFDVQMHTAAPNSSLIRTTRDIACASTPGWVHITGTIDSNASQPLCAMVLANGQQMFTCEESQGRYDFTVPLDQNNQVTVFGFADGFQPYRDTFGTSECGNTDSTSSSLEGTLTLMRGQSVGGISVTAGATFFPRLPATEYIGKCPDLDECVLNVDKPTDSAELVTTFDAGPVIDLKRGDGRAISIPLNPYAPTSNEFMYFELLSDSSFYEGGQSYIFSGSGGVDVGAFATPPLTAPADLNLLSPMPSAPPFIVYHDANTPLALTWNGNNENGEVEVEVFDVTATAAYTIICRFVDDGTAEVSAAPLGQLRDALITTPSLLATSGLTISRRNFRIFETTGLKLDVSIMSNASVALKLQ